VSRKGATAQYDKVTFRRWHSVTRYSETPVFTDKVAWQSVICTFTLGARLLQLFFHKNKLTPFTIPIRLPKDIKSV